MPLAGQVPDQGPRSQIAGRFIDDNRLGDIGIELFAIAPGERGLTYSVASLARQRRMRRAGFYKPVRQFRLGFAQLVGKGRIHISETAVAIDRIESDRRVFNKLDKLFLFGPDDPFKLVALGHILQPPDN